MKKISLILACSCNGGIGFENKLPWNIPDDLKNFRKITTKVSKEDNVNAIVMGRNTWESLPIKPLPKRKNIVLTLDPEYDCKEAIIANSMEDVFMFCSPNNIENIFIIGGAQIYKECLDNYRNYIDKIYITVVIDKFYQCDTFVDLDNILRTFHICEDNVYINNKCVYIVATNYNNN